MEGGQRHELYGLTPDDTHTFERASFQQRHPSRLHAGSGETHS